MLIHAMPFVGRCICAHGILEASPLRRLLTVSCCPVPDFARREEEDCPVILPLLLVNKTLCLYKKNNISYLFIVFFIL